ncbi:MAG: dihydrodipicolinate synthase family protein [Spirochaetaceae bacterium]|nr:MAG: dihydrodipicolinate synthase family protein [Spirochaetaceae bacterium]
MNAAEIRGSYATLLLPINANETIDYGRLEEEIATLIATRVDGIYSNGTAGEFHTQTEEEFRRVNELLATRCEASGIPFQVGASQMSPQLTLERIRAAKEWQPSAIQVILSDWFPLTDDEVMSCLERFCAVADPIGIVLYNPPHAKRVLPPALYGRIVHELPGVVGVKVAGGDDQWYEGMEAHLDALSLFVPGHLLASGVQRGAHGAYSNVACLNPRGATRWYQQMLTNMPGALELEGRIRAMMNEHILPFITRHGYCNAACDKLLAAVGDWAPVGTRLRWPYRWIPDTEADRLRPIIHAAIPELFAE